MVSIPFEIPMTKIRNITTVSTIGTLDIIFIKTPDNTLPIIYIFSRTGTLPLPPYEPTAIYARRLTLISLYKIKSTNKINNINKLIIPILVVKKKSINSENGFKNQFILFKNSSVSLIISNLIINN